MLNIKHIKYFNKILPKNFVFSEPGDCWAYGYDNSKIHVLPECVLFANNKNQIQDKTGIKSSYYFEKMLKTANLITLNRAFLIQKKLLDFDLRSKTTSFNQELEFELLLLLN